MWGAGGLGSRTKSSITAQRRPPRHSPCQHMSQHSTHTIALLVHTTQLIFYDFYILFYTVLYVIKNLSQNHVCATPLTVNIDRSSDVDNLNTEKLDYVVSTIKILYYSQL